MNRFSVYRWQVAALVLILTATSIWATIPEGQEQPSVGQAERSAVDPEPDPEASESPVQGGTPESRMQTCRDNLKQLATGLEMYATDHSGLYPKSLEELVPVYLPSLPLCPSTPRPTYAKGYKMGKDAPYNRDHYQEFYHLACAGKNHADVNFGVNEPAMNCQLGLLPEIQFRGTPQEARRACEENLKLLATTLEMYASDHQGHYPTSLSELGSTYLPKVPHCPSTGRDTYSVGMKTGPSAPHNSDDYRDYFYLKCSDSHRKSDPPTSPAYDSVRGLRDQP